MPRTIEPRPKLGAGLSREEEQELGRLIRGDDPAAALAARNRLAEANMALCVNVASRYLYRGISRDDLISEGNLGLMRAVEEFDPGRGTRFSTIAYHHIRGQILDAFKNRMNLIRVPVHVYKIRGRRDKAERDGRTLEMDDA